MKGKILLLMMLCIGGRLRAQYVYTITADSVKITGCDSSELIIENHTQAIPGFLYNKGRGRTEFRRALVQLDDTSYLVGGDTLRIPAGLWRRNGNHIYNINTGNVGIRRATPNVLLDLPGPVNIDDTSSYRINYIPVLRIGAWVDSVYNGNYDTTLYVHNYTNLYAGSQSGAYNAGSFATLIGSGAGYHNTGQYSTFAGYGAGYDSEGDGNTFFGFLSGQNSPNGFNSFFGMQSGQNSSGSANSFFGEQSGIQNQGTANTFGGAGSGVDNSGNYNTFLGVGSGGRSSGDENCFMGESSGMYNVGNRNVMLGANSAANSSGDYNVYVGDYAGTSTFGSQNTFIGAGKFDARTYGANGVTLIGYRALVMPPISSISNAAAIGSNAVVKGSNTMVFGDTAVKTFLFNTNAVAVSGRVLIVGSNSTNGNGAYLTTGGVWSNASDRGKKEHFEALNSQDLLEKIAALPVTRWNYKGLTEQHIGPVAQDFYRIFRVGADDKSISTIDPSGIALAGVQGLYQKWQEAERRAEEQRSLIGVQQSQIADLQNRLKAQEGQSAEQAAQFNRLLDKFQRLETALEKGLQTRENKEAYTKK